MNHVVLRVEHILQIAGKRVEAIVRVTLSFFFDDAHSALSTGVSSRALAAFMIHYVHSFNFYSTVYAWNKYVRANGLVFFDVSSNTLLFTFLVSLTLSRRKLAQSVVVLDFFVRKNLLAAELLVVANKLHIFKLLFDFFFNVDKAGLVAEHRALTCFFRELVETNLVEPIVALLALPWVQKDGLAQGTQELGLHLICADHVLRIHAERHALEVVRGLAHRIRS